MPAQWNNISDVKEHCFGCAVCAAVCPHQAIEMIADHEGFMVPSVAVDQCVNCGLCRNTCPALAEHEKLTYRAYALRCSDEQLLKASTSGGAFSLIAQAVTDMGGEVCGAAFDDSLRLRHCMSKQISGMRKSKYVQSDLREVLPVIRERLCHGIPVLFSGTPCQCHAVQLFTGGDENLYTLALLCRGVFSPGLWNGYRELLEQDGKITSFCFRSKERDDDAHTVSYVISGNTVTRPFNEDPLMLMYSRDIILRDSCYSCPYTSPDVPFDFSIGDFWGIEKAIPSLADGKGTSLVLTRSEKAEALIRRISETNYVERTFISDILQPALKAPAPVSPLRRQYKELCEKTPLPVSEILELVKDGGQPVLSEEERRDTYRSVFRNRMVQKKHARLTNHSFSLIANDPVSSDMFQGIDCHSPFIGVTISNPDFLKLLDNLPHYMNCPLQMVTDDRSLYPEGMLDDIRIIFTKCHTERDALNNWNQGMKQLQYDNLYILFACADNSPDDLRRFDRLSFPNKKALVTEPVPDIACVVPLAVQPQANGRYDFAAFKDGQSLQKYYDDFDYIGWLNGQTA